MESSLWRPAYYEDFRTKTTGSHVALRERNSGAESGRGLFIDSKDAEAFWSALEKNLLVWGCAFVVSDVISGGLLDYLGPLHLALGPHRKMVVFR